MDQPSTDSPAAMNERPLSRRIRAPLDDREWVVLPFKGHVERPNHGAVAYGHRTSVDVQDQIAGKNKGGGAAASRHFKSACGEVTTIAERARATRCLKLGASRSVARGTVRPQKRTSGAWPNLIPPRSPGRARDGGSAACRAALKRDASVGPFVNGRRGPVSPRPWLPSQRPRGRRQVLEPIPIRSSPSARDQHV